MPSYTIKDSTISEIELTQLYMISKRPYQENLQNLDIIFDVANRNRGLFPKINISGIQNEEVYISKWIKNYIDALRVPPSTRTAPPKGSCSDPSVRAIVKKIRGLDEETIARLEKYHDLFMSAENIQGNLLEEYINGQTAQYGWIWCQGSVLRAVDFCNTNGNVLLQVKNKSNTENSSSSAIREGTTIEKWYRLGTRRVNGRPEPSYKWDKLNDIINRYREEDADIPACNITEQGYQQFLEDITNQNNSIITDR